MSLLPEYNTGLIERLKPIKLLGNWTREVIETTKHKRLWYENTNIKDPDCDANSLELKAYNGDPHSLRWANAVKLHRRQKNRNTHT